MLPSQSNRANENSGARPYFLHDEPVAARDVHASKRLCSLSWTVNDLVIGRASRQLPGFARVIDCGFRCHSQRADLIQPSENAHPLSLRLLAIARGSGCLSSRFAAGLWCFETRAGRRFGQSTMLASRLLFWSVDIQGCHRTTQAFCVPLTPERSTNLCDRSRLSFAQLMNPRPRSWLFVRREIASGSGARLIILEVVPLGVTIYGPASDEYLTQMEERLGQFQVKDPAVRVERRIVEGNPAAEILRAAEESDCDLIVMASHGRTGAKRIMLGSVAETVLRGSRCPVLIVKTPESATESSSTTEAKDAGNFVSLKT